MAGERGSDGWQGKSDSMDGRGTADLMGIKGVKGNQWIARENVSDRWQGERDLMDGRVSDG